MSSTQSDSFPTRAIRMLRLPEVKALTGLSKTEIYRQIAAGRFPKGLRQSHKVVVWPEPLIARHQQQMLPPELRALLG